MDNISIFTAFSAGVLSFISPCVLPLIPAYLSFISGLSLDELTAEEKNRKVLAKVTVNTLFFIAGFSVVFIALGAGATFVGAILKANMRLMSLISGIILLVLALHLIGVINIGFLNVERRVQVKQRKSFGPVGSFLVGLAFASGWTPCIGPILLGILGIAASQESVGRGILLLGVYSSGLGIPFLLTSISVNGFFLAFGKVKKYYRQIEVVCGLILVLAAGYMIYSAYATGDVTQDIVFSDVEGGAFNLAELKGNVVLINFWATFCDPCRKEMPELNELFKKNKRNDFKIIGVSVDTDKQKALKFARSLGVEYPIYFGTQNDIATLGERKALPTNLILDREGRKAAGYTGFPGIEPIQKKVAALLETKQ